MDDQKNFVSLPLEIKRKIWQKLDLTSKKALADSLHDPEKCKEKKNCKAHLCPNSPAKALIDLDKPDFKPRVYCPLCQTNLLFKEFGGETVTGPVNETNPLQYYHRQSRKNKLLAEENDLTGRIR